MMTLYGYFRSSAAYRVRIALNLKGLSYDQRPVNLVKSEQRSEAFRQYNPQGLVPALVTENGGVLTQSLAICEYLEERYPAPSLLPNDAEGRARVRALAQLLASDVHPLNNLRVLQYLVQKLGVNEDTKMTWYRHWITEGFVAMEAMLSQAAATGQCCHGDTPTLADLCLVPQVYNAERFNCDLSDYPTVQRVAEHCRTLPAFQTAEPGKQPDSPQ